MVPTSGEASSQPIPLRVRPCLCAWPECKDFQKILIQKGDELFGGYVRFRFTEDNHEFKAVVEKCTSCPPGTIVAERPYIAKHHFTAEQLRFQVEELKAKRGQYSLHIPITRTLHQNMVYQGSYDPSHIAKSSIGQGTVLFYQAPSVPKNAVQAYLNKFCHNSRQERQERTALERQKKHELVALESQKQQKLAALERQKQREFTALEWHKQQKLAALERQKQRESTALKWQKKHESAALKSQKQQKLAAVKRQKQRKSVALERQKQRELAALEKQEQIELAALVRQEQDEERQKGREEWQKQKKKRKSKEDSERSPFEWRSVVNSITEFKNSVVVELQVAFDLAATLEEAKKAAEAAQKAAEEGKESADKKCSRAERSLMRQSSDFGAGSLLGVVKEFLSCHGGLSRFTLASDDWHMKHPNASVTLFGFTSFQETKTYIQAFFPEIEPKSSEFFYDHTKKKLNIRSEGCTELAGLEICLAVLMFMHSIPVRRRLALVWGVHERTMGRYIQAWLPFWGKIGEQLSILDVNRAYIDAERPLEYEKDDLRDVSNLADGKDYMTEIKRSDRLLQRFQISSKVHAGAARCITWTTPSGLCVEYTKLFGGRVTENELVELWGSLGIAYAELEKWKGYANTRETTVPPQLKLVTAIDKVSRKLLVSAKEAAAISAMVNDNDENNGEPGDEDDEMEQPIAAVKPANYIDFWGDGLIDFKAREKSNQLKKDNADVKTIYIDSKDEIRKEAQDALKSGPLSSAEELLAQMLLHERLHLLYEDGELRHTSLSYYLKFFEKTRHDILAWLGDYSMLNPNYEVPEEPPKIALRLAKFPADTKSLCDKGFDRTDKSYPFFNMVVTPVLLRYSSIKQYLPKDVKGAGGDEEKCRARYSSEAAFSRTTIQETLKDVIAYENMAYLPHLHAWGHAAINLRRPFRIPANNSIVLPAYWSENTDELPTP